MTLDQDARLFECTFILAMHSVQAIGTISEFLWELSLGLYCTFKGFQPSSSILRADARADRTAAMPAASPA
jgi:hypothetical protein